MKKKYLIIGAVVLAMVILGVWAVPVFASNASNATQTTQITQDTPRLRLLARLLLIQDESKVDALIAQAKDAGKLTDDQATKLKTFWTNHHEQFAKKVVLTRLIWANDGTKVQAFLDKAVAEGKITPEQEQNVMTLWNKLHSK